MQHFEGKVAFVTGGASGIGLATAHAFAEASMKVMLADIEENALAAALVSLRNAGAEVRGVVCDVADRTAMQHAARETFAAFGKVHIVFNNAGVGSGGQMELITPGDWEWVIGVNLMGVIYGIEAFLPHIKAHGEGGHIINNSSLLGIVSPPAGTGPYGATKAAVVALSETLAAELAGTGIGVSVLCSGGFVRTRFADSARNRAKRFGAQLEAPAAAKTNLAALVRSGTDPQLVARQVMMGIRNNDLYIFTETLSRSTVEERFGRILAAYDKSTIVQE